MGTSYKGAGRAPAWRYEAIVALIRYHTTVSAWPCEYICSLLTFVLNFNTCYVLNKQAIYTKRYESFVFLISGYKSHVFNNNNNNIIIETGNDLNRAEPVPTHLLPHRRLRATPAALAALAGPTLMLSLTFKINCHSHK